MWTAVCVQPNIVMTGHQNLQHSYEENGQEILILCKQYNPIALAQKDRMWGGNDNVKGVQKSRVKTSLECSGRTPNFFTVSEKIRTYVFCCFIWTAIKK